MRLFHCLAILRFRDLFGMVSSRDPFKGCCWWPPTFGDQKITLNHLVGDILFVCLRWFFYGFYHWKSELNHHFFGNILMFSKHQTSRSISHLYMIRILQQNLDSCPLRGCCRILVVIKASDFRRHPSSTKIWITQIRVWHKIQMGVSKNNGTPKSSILIGFSIVNLPFWGTTIFGNTQIKWHPCYMFPKPPTFRD